MLLGKLGGNVCSYALVSKQRTSVTASGFRGVACRNDRTSKCSGRCVSSWDLGMWDGHDG